MEALTRMVDEERQDVLRSAAAGDEYAFRRIVAEHHEDMRRVCLAVFRDHAIAEDATQAAWLVAWKKLGHVHGPEQLRPWLVSVAVNEAKVLMRKRRRQAEVEVTAAAASEPGGGDPARHIPNVDLRAAMARLEPDDRALLAMRYVAGFDSNELSAATGISPSGTRSRIERLLKRLREDLADA
jgi:RNA polymerase sigma-70 factor (ECF subfamily)